MGLFTKYCPVCGSKLEKTGYAFPYPPWRCPNCIERNDMKKEIEELKHQKRSQQS